MVIFNALTGVFSRKQDLLKREVLPEKRNKKRSRQLPAASAAGNGHHQLSPSQNNADLIHTMTTWDDMAAGVRVSSGAVYPTLSENMLIAMDKEGKL